MVEGFTAAMESLAADRSRCGALSAGAHERSSRFFTWDNRARKIAEIYRWVLDPSLPKPQFYGT